MLSLANTTKFHLKRQILLKETTIIMKHHLALNILLIAVAASNFNPVASTPIPDTATLQTAVNDYCNGVVAVHPTYGPIEGWDVSQVTTMMELFKNKPSCNPAIGNWDVSAVTNFQGMFAGATDFNQDIGGWDVSSGTIFYDMFSGATSFNQDIGGWDVSSGTDFYNMFDGATDFNQDIGGWDVSSGTYFFNMFAGATSFNQDIGGWDVSSGTRFYNMFSGATAFNQDLSGWDVSSGTVFFTMFAGATAFNQDIGGWDVSSGTVFHEMFKSASAFNQPSLYCDWQSKNNNFSNGIDVCLDTISCGWGDTCTTTAGGGGDPHFNLFDKKFITFQGLCDVVLTKSPDGADGSNLLVHARLSQPPTQRSGHEFTLISEVALAIGDDTFEIQNVGGRLLRNGSIFESKYNDQQPGNVIFAGASYSISKDVKGQEVSYKFSFANGSSIDVRVKKKKKMAFVELNGNFGGSPHMEGLLGNPNKKQGLYGRNGMLMANQKDVNAYGNEWQVLETEPKLFVQSDRYPQHPDKCIVIDMYKFEPGFHNSSVRGGRKTRRLLGEETSGISLKEAEEACRGSKGLMKKFCIDDVMSTDSVEIGKDPFYRH